MLRFKWWLQKVEETATGASCVAVFARPMFSEPFKRELPHEHRKRRKRKKKKS